MVTNGKEGEEAREDLKRARQEAERAKQRGKREVVKLSAHDFADAVLPIVLTSGDPCEN